MKQLKIKTIQKGAPVVNAGCIEKKCLHFAKLYIDMSSKYCGIYHWFNSVDNIPKIYIQAKKESLHLSPDCGRRKETIIELPQFEGWDIIHASIGKYTLTIYLEKQ